jgi:hypothetical protein
VREIKLKLTSAKHAALESLRKHLTGDVDADLTPEQKRERLNYLLQKAGYVRPNTETNHDAKITPLCIDQFVAIYDCYPVDLRHS